MSEDDRSTASGPVFISVLLLGLSLLSVIVAWMLRGHWIPWWNELGIHLPGITVLWVSPVWHGVGAVILAAFAGMTAFRAVFAIGLGLWVFSYLLYAAHTFLAIYLPWVKVHETLGVKASG